MDPMDSESKRLRPGRKPLEAFPKQAEVRVTLHPADLPFVREIADELDMSPNQAIRRIVRQYHRLYDAGGDIGVVRPDRRGAVRASGE